MATTTQLRDWWAPPCTGPLERVELHGEGRVSVRSAIVPAVHALDACLRAHDYRTRRADTGAYNCRRITGGTRYSLHAYGIALDLNWQSNPYGPRLVTDMPPAMVAAIKGIRTRNGRQVWRWGGDYRGNKDAMHYEVVCHPDDLAAGIDPATVPGHQHSPEEDDMAQQVNFYAPIDPDDEASNHAYLVTNNVGKYLPTAEAIGLCSALGIPRGNQPDQPLDATWQSVTILVDGPCRNTP